MNQTFGDKDADSLFSETALSRICQGEGKYIVFVSILEFLSTTMSNCS